MNFTTGAMLLDFCKEQQCTISEAMILREMEVFGRDRGEILAQMEHSYEIMKNAVHEGISGECRSIGGLIGGEAKRLMDFLETGKTGGATLISRAGAYAMGVLEVNASMGLIVAAPTAGSAGVIPGAFIAMQEEMDLEDSAMVQALFNAGAVGYLIMRNSTVAGAEGGCQAEIGAAAAMAASAIVEIIGGTPEQSLQAASDVIANMLGLVCDPIAGLVEAPCQKRNATGASNALISAQMAVSGVPSLIPFDEMVEAMYRVGRSIPYELRETALGGTAATPTACDLCDQIFCDRR